MPSRSSSTNPLVALAGIVLLPAVALVGLWWFASGQTERDSEPVPTTAPGTPPPPAPGPPLSTPLISFRRVPGLIARDLNSDAFREQVAGLANTLDATSCMVVQLDGVGVGAHNPDLAVIPASNEKLLVAAAALHVLGSDFRFTTEVRGALANGVVAGDLYLVGGGDPLLTTADYPAETINGYPVLNATPLESLADAVVAAGVTQVQGNIVGDGSRYGEERFHPNWHEELYVTEAGPISALMVNDVRYFTSDWQTANDPNAGAAEELGRLLEERGVSIGGEGASGATPEGTATIATLTSAPLPDVITEMQATSDNNTAEMLLKELGVASGAGGSWEAGAAAVVAALADMGIDTTGVVVDDGSGLSSENRATCRVMAEILNRYEPGDEFAAGLPLAGDQSTTLRDNFVGSAVEGRLYGKTGTLHNEPYNADPPAVKALSGYVSVDGGGTIEYSLILNSAGTLPEQTVYRPIWNAFAEVLGAYPSGPTAAQLGPG